MSANTAPRNGPSKKLQGADALLEQETLTGQHVHRVIRAVVGDNDPTAAESILGPLSAHGWRATARSIGALKLHDNDDEGVRRP
jgi:hypothetical protein